LVWTGNSAANGVWDLTDAPTTEKLPDETSGWEIYAVDGYYAAYFDKDRIVSFDDGADNGEVTIKNSGTAHQMELNNTTLDYTFTGTGSNTLSVDTLLANGGGKASFNKIQLTTTASTISNHTVSMGSGATWLGNATVSANGTIDLAGGTLSLTQLMLKGGTLSISSTGSTLQSGTVAVTSGSTLLFAPTGTGNTPMLTIGSGVSFSGSALDICMGGNSLIVDTTYALISFENAATNWDTLFTTEHGELSYSNNVLYIFYNPVPKLTWSNTNGTWSSTQWGSTYTESNGLRAEFTGSGTRTVTISGTVTPHSVKVDNTGSVTFSGSGNISGSTTLKKDGSGVLTINTSNTYSGGSTLAAGTINVGHANALGTGEVTLKNGTLNLAGKAIANTLTVAGDVTINGGSAYNGALVLENGNLSGNELRLNKNATLKSGSISNILSGGGMVTKTGSDTTILRAANTYSGGTIINGGTLVAEHAKALGTGTITINQGTLDMSGKALANAINIGSGQAELLHTGNYSGALSLRSGTLTAAGGDLACGSLTLNGGKLLLSSEGVALDAPLVDVNGTLTISAATQIGFTDFYTLGTHVLFEFGSLSGNISNLTLIPQAGKKLEYNLYTEGNRILVDIKNSGALLYWQGKGIWSEGGGCWQQGKKFEQGDQAQFTQVAQVTLQGQLAPSVIIVDCAQAVTFTGTGSIIGSADLTKENAGVFTLNAANPEWSGNIYQKSGTITATGNTSFGTGEIHASGGTLNLAGKAIDNDIYVTNNATVCIMGGNKYTGSMDVMGNLAVKSNIHIAEGETLTLRKGKHSATVTGKGTMHITEGTVTLQTGKYSMNGITIDSKLIVNKQGLTLAKTDSFISINEDGNLTSSGKITGCQLSLYGGSLSMRNATPAAITLTGAFYAEDSATAQVYAAVKCDSFELNDSYFRILGDKPQAITVAKAMSLTDGRGLTTNGNITAGSLKVSNAKLTIDSAKAASLTLKDKTTDALIEDKSTVSITGKLTAAAGLSLTDATLTLAAPDAKNAPQAMSVKGKLNIKEGAELTTNGKVSAGWLDMDDAQFYLYNEKPQSLALTAKADAAKQPITNYITDSELYLNGSMSVAADLELNNTTIRLRDANPAKPKALGLTVKGDMTFSGNSELYLSGALSAKNLTLGSGSIFMTGSKLQTIKVGNELTLNGGTELNLGFTVTQADVDKRKAFKLFTFKVFDADVAATDLYSRLGLSQELCTLDFDKSRKAITLVVNDMEEWNKQAATVQNAQPTEAATANAAAAEEVEDMLFAPAPVAAEMAPELQKVADTLVQCTWGTVGASRAFTDTIANRGAYSTLFAGGRGAAWVSTMGGSSRISSDGGHAGADYTLTGAAFGIEARVTKDSTIGLAIG
ncbi:MAG: autotransporter-associated beta strand repeat-containing protein, partial [Akkermansia sp.]|nr:autotransporter-associated beta strand repeat-containing protein [Akkermansia sp.]